MSGTSRPRPPLLRPVRGNGISLHAQLYQRLRDAIASGELPAGARVPSVRSLASELGVARGTIEAVYQRLGSDGFLLARGPAGTVVAPGLDTPGLDTFTRAPPTPPAVSAAPPSSPAAPNDALRPFQLGVPALDAFPRKTWSRLAARTARRLDGGAMHYPDAAGLPALRQAIAAYLSVSRGFACSHENVFVTAGYRGALDLVCRTVLSAGDVGWHEDPGYFLARAFLQRAGMDLVPVPVDADGLQVEIGRLRAEHARFALLTPTHQSPMGMALSLPRRLSLLAWAGERRSWLIEDDYDSEFRYHGRPLAPLKSLDRDGRVLYTGTFSKVVFPGLRLGYLVVPSALKERFEQAAADSPGPGAIQPQATLAAFIEEGHFARHLRKMRMLYAARRGWLADALTETFGARLPVQPQAAGIHLLVRTDRISHASQGDVALAAAAQARGLAVHALGAWQMGQPSCGGLLLGFANITSREDAVALVLRLRDALLST